MGRTGSGDRTAFHREPSASTQYTNGKAKPAKAGDAKPRVYNRKEPVRIARPLNLYFDFEQD